ncbi:hypothetical protein A3C60_01870 [Candidatus Nomurabacteria bacterium RIFCSPHIGHO2_02_FULL_37_45]|uniref:HD domain-containing protein n=1 Tax=Candidatus Nomurabacteria bacterium RIFCSPHIGHO2_12_FULL_37_29 TaxID=1801759 RepID=A0A1F6WB54_9BACT|nr:MAG: hypothetical protein A2727_02230 [Candidatus Nomurabacteria bacterium RIFCSPHIGHO2_01_FULL_37_110]OGI71162.1 MAG: hypothetical protein A3C60_01870 [Candidatus Nomurabacteria bacterium RIFCSPHIGHO2_02_FULL_37_45]OGI79138.1 MAG: hypothetical protein A3F19_00265 [Candidatus Nomurabacteria bacterium RIFCSPHIGHO2_12_FULL_37_29]OGI85486.1 MAG: hypothetical protein A3A92_02475 [Candidatus Nomurabacteria bacterium RIFCSPLOWO2_01_FULL_37_49]
MNQELKNKIMEILLKENKKEYVCHIQYVVKIGLELAEENKVDPNIVEIACLLHDIGRDKELPGEHHSQTGKRIAEEILKDSLLSQEQQKKIVQCILAHGFDDTPLSTEEQIVRSADAGSKVEYHEAFMLMCKKITYEERLAWGNKYLQKGFEKISIQSYKEKVEQKYTAINAIYQKILSMI